MFGDSAVHCSDGMNRISCKNYACSMHLTLSAAGCRCCPHRGIQVSQQVVGQGCEFASRVAAPGRSNGDESSLRAEGHRAHTCCGGRGGGTSLTVLLYVHSSNLTLETAAHILCCWCVGCALPYLQDSQGRMWFKKYVNLAPALVQQSKKQSMLTSIQVSPPLVTVWLPLLRSDT